VLAKEFPTTGENSAQRVSGQTVIINVLVNDCDTIDYRNTYGLGSEVIDMVKVIVDVTTPDKPTTTTVEFRILGDRYWVIVAQWCGYYCYVWYQWFFAKCH
jgi:hypothetical protein